MNLIGERVINIRINYIIGTIVGVPDDNRITVRYGQDDKTYIYPNAFRDFLRFADPDLQTKVELLLHESPTRHTERTRSVVRNINIPPCPTVQPLWVEKESSASVLNNRRLDMYCSYGSAAQDIYLNCCRVFGWDERRRVEFAQHTNLYGKRITQENYSLWFLPRHCWLERERDASRRWYNTVGRDVIYEEWTDALLTESDWDNLNNDFSFRLTFAKGKNGKYYYIGVFKPCTIIENQLNPLGQLIHTKIYKRINSAMHYPRQ